MSPYVASTVLRGCLAGVCFMGSILPFLPRGIFDDAATKVMGAAFDAARKALDDTGNQTLCKKSWRVGSSLPPAKANAS